MHATGRAVRRQARGGGDAVIAAFLLAVLLIAVLYLLLVASAGQRGVEHAALLRATLVASMPSALFVGYALYAVLASAL